MGDIVKVAHIQQALRFYYILYALLMQPKKTDTAAYKI